MIGNASGRASKQLIGEPNGGGEAIGLLLLVSQKELLTVSEDGCGFSPDSCLLLLGQTSPPPREGINFCCLCDGMVATGTKEAAWYLGH